MGYYPPPPGPEAQPPPPEEERFDCMSFPPGAAQLYGVLFILVGMHMQPLQSCATPTSSRLWAALFP